MNISQWMVGIQLIRALRYRLVVGVSVSHAGDRWFMPRPGHTKDHHQSNGTHCLTAFTQALG